MNIIDRFSFTLNGNALLLCSVAHQINHHGNAAFGRTATECLINICHFSKERKEQRVGLQQMTILLNALEFLISSLTSSQFTQK
jgi:hypothetical protein